MASLQQARRERIGDLKLPPQYHVPTAEKQVALPPFFPKKQPIHASSPVPVAYDYEGFLNHGVMLKTWKPLPSSAARTVPSSMGPFAEASLYPF